MHSRIFEVISYDDDYKGKFKSNCTEEDILDYYQYDRFFDYVSDDTDFIHDLQWLQGQVPMFFENAVRKPCAMNLTDYNKESYFIPKLFRIKDLVKTLSISEFIDYWDMKTYEISQNIEEKCAFRVAVFNTDGELQGMYTFDSFVRLYSGKFHVINSFDYHF